MKGATKARGLTLHVDHRVLLRRLDERIVLLFALAHGILQVGLLEEFPRLRIWEIVGLYLYL